MINLEKIVTFWNQSFIIDKYQLNYTITFIHCMDHMDSFQCKIPRLVEKIPLFANFHNHVFTNATFLHFLDQQKSLSNSKCSISNFSKLSPQKKCIFSMIEKMINIYIFSFDYRTCFQLKQDSTKGKVFIKPNRKSSKGQAHHMFLQILNLHFFYFFSVLDIKKQNHQFKNSRI